MIASSDKDYKQTKLIKQGKKKLSSTFRELAEWINKEYGVKVLNIYYEKNTIVNKPRLTIIFERKKEEEKFTKGKGPAAPYDKEKQKIIAEKFAYFMKRQKRAEKFKTENVLVIFSAFAPVAREEVNENIPAKELKKLQKRLNNDNIWRIEKYFAVTIFFFYTEKQVEEAQKNGMREHLADEYFKLLKQYDEFDYYTRSSYSVRLDSKENFDNNYDGNWFYYYR